jgi:hypothetical protein
LLGYPEAMRFRNLWKKFFLIIFENFDFQILLFLNSKKSELGIRVFFENELGGSRYFFFPDLRQTRGAKKITKTVRIFEDPKLLDIRIVKNHHSTLIHSLPIEIR